MKNIIWTIFANMVSIFVAGYFVTDFVVGGWTTALFAAIAFSIINLIIKPLIKLIALPFTIITLGLFRFIVNGILVYILAAFSGVSVESFFGAILAAIVISLVNTVLGWFSGDDK